LNGYAGDTEDHREHRVAQRRRWRIEKKTMGFAVRNTEAVLKGLRGRYGKREGRRWGNGVEVLVETILSQNTSNRNSEAGYRQLRRRFKTWEAVADAAEEEVERWIRVAGLSRIKAPRIQAILRRVRAERGRITLEFLRRMTAEEAGAYLRKFKGIGPKTGGLGGRFRRRRRMGFWRGRFRRGIGMRCMCC
jgi:endonuclease III